MAQHPEQSDYPLVQEQTPEEFTAANSELEVEEEYHPYCVTASELVDEVAELLETLGPEIARNRLMAGIMTAFIDGTEEGRRLFKAEHDRAKTQKQFGLARNQQGVRND